MVKRKASDKLRDWRLALRLLREDRRLMREALIALRDLTISGETPTWIEYERVPLAVAKEFEYAREIVTRLSLFLKE